MTLAEKHIPDWIAEFERLEHHVENALHYSGGTHAVEDIFKGVLVGEFQIWTGPDSIIISEILEYPQLRALNFFLAGGHMDEIQEMEKTVVEWARSQGCSRATVAGRDGWSRTFLRERGYEPKWHVMSREIRDE